MFRGRMRRERREGGAGTQRGREREVLEDGKEREEREGGKGKRGTQQRVKRFVICSESQREEISRGGGGGYEESSYEHGKEPDEMRR